MTTTTTAAPPLVFVDTETTSLNRLTRRAWEVALIRRNQDGGETECSFLVADVDLADADPMSLKIGRFYDRFRQSHENRDDGRDYVTELGAARIVEKMTRGAVLVGAVPSFDEETLAAMLRRQGLCPAWHYHLVDVETLAAGALRMPPPWNFDKVLAAYGLIYDEADRHTALGDARMARDLYDAVLADGTAVGAAFRSGRVDAANEIVKASDHGFRAYDRALKIAGEVSR